MNEVSMDAGPYQSPQSPSRDTPAAPRFFLLASLTVFGTAIVGSLLGGIFGSVIGALAPGYYRAVIRNSDAIDFDPVQVGLGMGISQGFVGGLAVGVVIVAMYCWMRMRGRARAANAPSAK